MDFARRILSRYMGSPASLAIVPAKSGPGWLSSHFIGSYPNETVDLTLVRERSEITAQEGAKPLWEGYQSVENYPRDTTGNRTSEQVRTSEDLGACYACIAVRRRPEFIVEFGTAFGISGMYWLTGLEMANHGKLITYEPNIIWADIAERNLKAISNRYLLTRGTFEDNASKTLHQQTVDIAFIDAIHTSTFVNAQYEVMAPYLKKGALVLFDDINFSDDMRRCWEAFSVKDDVVASAKIGDRVGIIELH